MDTSKRDLTTPPDLQDHGKGTGAMRSQKPIYQDSLPPCNNACPAGENIQAWLAFAQQGRHEDAWQVIMENNALPAVHGRVCYHPCEDSCNRKYVDSSVSIHAIERFLGDLAIEKGWMPIYPEKWSGKKVLVIGAGPSGLSAAYHLTRMGHQVEIREAGPIAGGMMHFGIPAYRLPRDILDAEIGRIEKMGVKFTLNHKVENVLDEMRDGGFDAVFIAVGAHISHKVNIPARDAGKMMDAISYLKSVKEGNAPKLGRRVAIYGGGNTAIDAARTAKRMGADEALIIYRRDRESMPAHDFETEDALAEGVKINWLRTIKQIDQQTFKVEVMKLVDGKPVPTGEFEELKADSLIMALGQNTDTGFLKGIPGINFKANDTVIVGKDMMTGHPGIFAGGDMVPSERTVTVAVGHGKKAARNIDAYLTNSTYHPAPKHPIVGHERLHIWYQTHAPQQEQDALNPVSRTDSFEEIVKGFSETEARYESQRCLSCGNCFECDGCYGACPEDAVIKLGPGKRYRFDYDKCTGCAVCYEQCPCSAIEMTTDKASLKI